MSAETGEGVDQATAAAAAGAPGSLDEALGAPGQLADEIASELGAGTGAADGSTPVTPMVLDELVEEAEGPLSMRDMRILADIDVEVSVEFGRTRLALRDLLALRRGSLVELSRGLDQPVSVLANDTLVAYGEIVMVGDRFGVHVLEIVDPDERGRPKRVERTIPGRVDPDALTAASAVDTGVAAPEDAAADGEM